MLLKPVFSTDIIFTYFICRFLILVIMRAKHSEQPPRKRNMSLSYDWDRVVASERNLTNRKISRCLTDSFDGFGAFHPGYINIERSRHEFITGSNYVGQWNSVGMSGSGLFIFPHDRTKPNQSLSYLFPICKLTIIKYMLYNMSRKCPNRPEREQHEHNQEDHDKDFSMELSPEERQRSLSVDWFNIITTPESINKKKAIIVLQTNSIKRARLSGVFCTTKNVLSCEYCTGSLYDGAIDKLGMAGAGKYTLPYGKRVEYEGSLHDGMFHGEGTLTYPMGQKMDGEWVKGKMVSFKYRFSDSLEYDIPWKYCQMPDRRFYTSIQEGLRPAGRSLATNDHVTRKIPEGCYDTGDGFYNPATKCVTSAINPEKILRVPTTTEEKWIMKNCRKAWDEPAGYRPDLYEHWVTGRNSDSVFLDSENDSSNSTNNSGCQSTSTAVDEERIDMIVSADKNVFAQSSGANWWNNIPAARS